MLSIELIVDLTCSSLIFVLSFRFGDLGVEAVDPVWLFGKGEKTGEKCNNGEGSAFLNDELRSNFANLIGVEKLVLIVKGWENETDFRYFGFAF